MNMRHGKHEFFKEIISELNLSEEQKLKFEEIKKIGQKEKFILIAKFLLGRAEHKDIMNALLEKIKKLEELLTNEQKENLKEILLEKHKDMFIKLLEHKHREIKEMFEELELTEEQKDKIEGLLSKIQDKNCFEIQEEIESILSDSQKEKAEIYIKSLIGLDKIFEELELNEEQKNKLKEVHEELKSQKKEMIKKIKDGEISFSELFTKKIEIFSKLENILTKKQIKKIHKLHNHRKSCFM